MHTCQVVKTDEPSNFEEAVKYKEWQDAMNDEMQALVNNKTWTLVPKNKEMKPIGSKWVYKLKRNSDGSISRYKARLVAKGYCSKYDLYYDKTFSPITKINIIRTIIIIAASKGWKLYQLDVKNAFLNGELEEEIYMEQPYGYVHTKYSNYVCKLKKALYGLKQGPRAWYAKLVESLMCVGFHEVKVDP